MSGRRDRSASASLAISAARPASSSVCDISPASSSRCSSVSELSSRCAADIRRTSESTSCSRFCGCSGNISPNSAMKSSKSCWVCVPSASASSISLSLAIMSLTRCIASGSGSSSVCFMPRNWLSSTSRRSRSFSFSKVSLAVAERQS